MSRIEINIDRVVLRGFDAAGRAAFVDGLRAELARALADPTRRAEWLGSRRLPVLRMGKVAMQSGPSGARRLGVNVAQAIRKGMGR